MRYGKRQLQISERLVRQLSRWAIKDIVKAIVELVTNSDDSYRRLEERGIPGSGIIKIGLIRKHKNSILIVSDEAEGMDDETMDQRVGRYAEDTSGFTKGAGVRGFFGRGLKDAIIALGDGEIVSIRDSTVYSCSLQKDNCSFELKPPEKLKKSEMREIEEKLGIRHHGTQIQIVIKNEQIPIPQYDNLSQCLEMYFSLRDINASDKRTIQIYEVDSKGNLKRAPQNICYRYPLGKEVCNCIFQIPYRGGNHDAKLTIHQAKLNLNQDDQYGEGGILVTSRHAIHDKSLFGFENNVFAHRLFGRLECPYLDDLLRADEAIISDKRAGLDYHHEFIKALKDEAAKELRKVVDEIEKEEKGKQKDLENERTKKLFQTALKKLNEIAKSELEDADQTGTEHGKEPKEPDPPKDGFNFVPDYYKIAVGQRAALSLRATTPYVIPLNCSVTIESDSPEIEVVEANSAQITKDLTDRRGIATINPKVVGRRAGSDGVVTAFAAGKKCEALIEVVSKIDGEPRPQKPRSGFFTEIKYNPHLDPRVRHLYDRATGVISISTNAPSVKKYLGPNGENQDEDHCKVLIAELLTDALCREIARRRIETGRVPVLDGNTSAAVEREMNRLIFQYAASIHTVFVK